MRAIPPDYHDLVRVLAAAGQSAAAIFRVLESKASRDGVPVTFTRQDVYTFSGATTAEKVFDATGLLEKLNERHKVQGLPFHFESDEEGRLSRVFIVLAGGLESHAKCLSFADVEVNETTVQYDLTVCCLALLLCDTLTRLYATQHKTNRYSMKLGIFTSVGGNGGTGMMAVTLSIDEKVDTFK